MKKINFLIHPNWQMNLIILCLFAMLFFYYKNKLFKRKYNLCFVICKYNIRDYLTNKLTARWTIFTLEKNRQSWAELHVVSVSQPQSIISVTISFALYIYTSINFTIYSAAFHSSVNLLTIPILILVFFILFHLTFYPLLREIFTVACRFSDIL